MILTLKSLTLQSFRSFSKPQTFHFGGKPGVYSVVGNNQHEPDLGANGAGKSSIWEGLFWVLQGTGIPKPNGLTPKGPSLLCRFSDLPMKGTLELEVNGEPMTIVRNYRPGSITIDEGLGQLETISQDTLNLKLGISPSFLHHGLFLGQGAISFLDLSPSEKLSFIDDLNESLRWDDYKKEASRRVSKCELELAKIDSSKESLEEHIVALDSEIVDLTKRSQLHQEEVQTEIDLRQEQLAAKQKALELCIAKLEGLDTTYDKLIEGIQLIEKEIGPIVEEVSDLEDLVAKKKAEISTLNINFVVSQKKLDKLQALTKAGKCPECGQKITKTYENKTRSSLETELSRNKEAKVREEAVLSKMKKDLELAERTKNSMLTKKQNLEIERHTTKSQISYEERSQKDIESAIGEIQSQISKLKIKKGTNPFQTLIEGKEKEARTKRGELKTLKEKRNAAQHALNLANFWATGFYELKLFRVAKIVDQLEISFNNALRELGMTGYHINLAVEKETKSKTISQKFHVSVKSPDEEKELSWESFSGGELQRLRLACACGMFDLVANLSGVRWNIEVYDEPTQHLSETGTESLLNLLERRALSHNKEIWFVDHHHVAYSSFTGKRTITKFSTGSIVE